MWLLAYVILPICPCVHPSIPTLGSPSFKLSVCLSNCLCVILVSLKSIVKNIVENSGRGKQGVMKRSQKDPICHKETNIEQETRTGWGARTPICTNEICNGNPSSISNQLQHKFVEIFVSHCCFIYFVSILFRYQAGHIASYHIGTEAHNGQK